LSERKTPQREKITKRAVDALQVGQSIADTEVRGFVVRRLPSGTVTYGYRYSNAAGTQRWLPLGLHGKITADQARTLAKKATGLAADGKDPVAEREKERAARKAELADTLQPVCEDYLVKRCGMVRDENGKPTFYGDLRSADQRLDAFERLVWPTLGKKPIAGIKRSEITKLLDTIEIENGPRQADLTLDYLSAVFNWYAVRSDDFKSPLVKGMKRVKSRERARTRALDDQEIRDLWVALDAAPDKLPGCYPRFVRCLLLTALRRREASHGTFDEVTTLRRDNIDGFNGKAWQIPASRMKNKLPHVVPLTPAVLALIDSKPGDAKAYIFSNTGGKQAFSGYSKAKAALDRVINGVRRADGRSPMPPWQMHDLRRSAKTLMQRAGVRPDISERVLSHVKSDLEKIYDQHEFLIEKADALKRLAALVERIVHPVDNVIEIPRSTTVEAVQATAL
jgi:integrase